MTAWRSKTHQLVTLGLMIGLALVVSWVELLIPLPVPGQKPGFANVFALFALVMWGVPSAFCLTFVRVLLLGLMTGLGFNFLCSIAGATGALLLMISVWLGSKKRIRLLLVSVTGALAHNLCQMLVACWIVGWRSIAPWFFPLMILAVLSGTVVGVLAETLVAKFAK